VISLRTILVCSGVSAALFAGLLWSDDITGEPQKHEYTVPHPECIYFGASHDKFANIGQSSTRLSAVTERVVAALPALAAPLHPSDASSGNTIDKYIFAALAAANVTPAPATTDYEFIRRVSLDLTGRIPTPDAVTSFVADTTPTKRAKLIDSLLANPQWVDKWTMYYGDLLKNNSRNTQIPRYPQGVSAFYKYIHDSLAANKPYDQMAKEIISTQGTDSYSQGEVNWLVGGVVTGGPVQDIWDQQTANVADTFLGIAHVNCLLCHNGRGHLDSLSLWASQTTRQQAWGLSSFMSHTNTSRTPVTKGTPLPYYWGLADNTVYTKDYPLNTTTGNRPARQPLTAGAPADVAPSYLWGGQAPSPGQDYRAALAQFVTSDFQFARATVNYIWAYFFGQGIVDPPDQFDPARLDPSNPPTAPWPQDTTQPWPLQPSNPQLLNALAQDFIDSKYDLKALMREITNSNTYQLSARYNGTWDPAWQSLFARKMVRRLWSEEVHDAIAQSSNVIPTYNTGVYGTMNWAMLFPEPVGVPDGANGSVTAFLDAFLRGNRDDQTRSGDGSISQALDLMDDNFVMSRVQLAKAPQNSLLQKTANLTNQQVVNTLFLTVLSRNPTDAEMSTALNNLNNGNRSQEIENLLWSLYNKVDFIFNY
jgi:hypothetical protein